MGPLELELIRNLGLHRHATKKRQAPVEAIHWKGQ